ncbi:MAG: hypothetical protein Q9227_000713 [Pyrenula ochraceoflavens]
MANASRIDVIKGHLRDLLNPRLLMKVHDIRFPWPKASKLDWQQVVDSLWNDDAERDRALYQIRFPIWTEMSKMPLNMLQQIDLPQLLLDRQSQDFPAQCVALVYILDQTRNCFRGTAIRYTNSFFDLLAEKAAATLFDDQNGGNGTPSRDSPFAKEAWLSRGWSFDDYTARMDWIWAALIHSELYMSKYRALNHGFISYFRAEIEEYSGKKDPCAQTQPEDERDLTLLQAITNGDPPSWQSLGGRDLDIADYAFWLLRMNTAHLAIVDQFGRYPYNNDQLGRDFETQEELDWMQENYPKGRVPEPLRGLIRKEIEEGIWSPLKGRADWL